MYYSHIEVVWLASAILLALGQVTIVAVMSYAPDDVDKAIDYYEWVSFPLDWLLKLTFVSLLFAIAMTWFYFVALANNPSSIGYAISIVVTIIGIALFFLLDLIMHRVLMSRLRPAILNKS